MQCGIYCCALSVSIPHTCYIEKNNRLLRLIRLGITSGEPTCRVPDFAVRKSGPVTSFLSGWLMKVTGGLDRKEGSFGDPAIAYPGRPKSRGERSGEICRLRPQRASSDGHGIRPSMKINALIAVHRGRPASKSWAKTRRNAAPRPAPSGHRAPSTGAFPVAAAGPVPRAWWRVTDNTPCVVLDKLRQLRCPVR